MTGVSLCPLLFALAIERLAQFIKITAHIKCFKYDNWKEKNVLYKDDILLSLGYHREPVNRAIKGF